MLELESGRLKTENRDARRIVEELILVMKDIASLLQYRLPLSDPVPCVSVEEGGDEPTANVNAYVYPNYIPGGW